MEQSLQQTLNNIRYVRLSDSQQLYHSEHKQALLTITQPTFTAVVALQGAQLLAFTAKDNIDWLWQNPKQSFAQGQPIIGGIPLCAPWFGNKKQPIHGFAQLHNWQLENIIETPGSVELIFGFQHLGNTLFTGPFYLQQLITLSARGISITLNWLNTGAQTLSDLSFAWHSYFACDDNQERPAKVYGLDQHLYYDNRQDLCQRLQQNTIQASTALDQVFCYANQPLQLAAKKQLHISGKHLPSSVIWRPETSDSHFGLNAYRYFLCVEKGCVFDNQFSLEPQQTFTATLRITD